VADEGSGSNPGDGRRPANEGSERDPFEDLGNPFEEVQEQSRSDHDVPSSSGISRENVEPPPERAADGARPRGDAGTIGARARMRHPIEEEIATLDEGAGVPSPPGYSSYPLGRERRVAGRAADHSAEAVERAFRDIKDELEQEAGEQTRSTNPFEALALRESRLTERLLTRLSGGVDFEDEAGQEEVGQVPSTNPFEALVLRDRRLTERRARLGGGVDDEAGQQTGSDTLGRDARRASLQAALEEQRADERQSREQENDGREGRD
jgi:hypothetical protein